MTSKLLEKDQGGELDIVDEHIQELASQEPNPEIEKSVQIIHNQISENCNNDPELVKYAYTFLGRMFYDQHNCEPISIKEILPYMPKKYPKLPENEF